MRRPQPAESSAPALSEQDLVRRASPTLAGIKTGNLFQLSFEDRNEFLEEVRGFNRRLAPRGVFVIPLRFRDGKALVYMVRPSRLKKDLEDADARSLLAAEGYDVSSIGRCLSHLIDRLEHAEEFPHEIGLFLSYPSEDVRGFIDNHAANYKYTGFWKVYGDVRKAKIQFSKYRRCTETYSRCLEHGRSFDDLCVML